MSGNTPDDYYIFNEKLRHSLVEKFVYLHATRKIEVNTTKGVIYERPKTELELQVESQYSRVGTIGYSGFITNVPSKTTVWDTKHVPDERFKDLLDLEKKYTGEIKYPKERLTELEEMLYPLVMDCVRENRIKGEFELPAFEDLTHQSINKRLRDLEDRVDRLDFSKAPKNPEASED
jgi:hypothetical protein